MASKRQIAVNRENAAKSKGPISPKGWHKSSQNSLRRGMLARTVVLDGDSHQRFLLLHDHFNPQTTVESTLVENMALASWRQRRIWATKKAGIAHEICRQSTSVELESSNYDDATRTALAFLALSDQSRSLDLMNRYETRYDRRYNHSFAHLMRLREKHEVSKRTQFFSDFDRFDFNAELRPISSKNPNEMTINLDFTSPAPWPRNPQNHLRGFAFLSPPKLASFARKRTQGAAEKFPHRPGPEPQART